MKLGIALLLALALPAQADHVNSRAFAGGVVTLQSGVVNPGQRAVLAADHTNSTTTFGQAAGLSVRALAPSRRQAWTVALFFSNTVAADGVKLNFSGVTASIFDASCILTTSVGAVTTQTNGFATSVNTSIRTATLSDTNTHLLSCTGGLQLNSAGDVTFAPSIAKDSNTTGVLTLLAGSWMMIEEIQ
jgi:hypothetical protein